MIPDRNDHAEVRMTRRVKVRLLPLRAPRQTVFYRPDPALSRMSAIQSADPKADRPLPTQPRHPLSAKAGLLSGYGCGRLNDGVRREGADDSSNLLCPDSALVQAGCF
jgi:hypothetical protein